MAIVLTSLLFANAPEPAHRGSGVELRMVASPAPTPTPVTTTTPALPTAAAPPPGRFATPRWDRQTPEWLRLEHKLPADHLARRLDRAIDRLDLSALYNTYAGTGSEAHRPDLLLKMVLFEMHSGHTSPAVWCEHIRYYEPLQWLGFGLQPARSRLYAFRDRLGPLLQVWHQQLLQLALDEDITTGTRGSLDGTTVAANASRHRLRSEATLQRHHEQLVAAITTDQAGAEQADLPGWMATTPAGRQQQQQQYQRTQPHMEQRQADNAQRPKDKRRARAAVRLSVSDPEAALGLDKLKVYRPLYNVQFISDLDSPLILAYDVFAQATDAGTLPHMLGRQTTLKDLLADAGYATALDLAACAAAGVTLYAPYHENDFSAAQRAQRPPPQLPKSAFTWREEQQTYQCPQGHLLHKESQERKKRADGQKLLVATYRCPGEHCQACPLRQQCAKLPAAGRTVQRSEFEGLVEALQQRMQTPAAKALYRRRGPTVELGFADVKEHRGLRTFSGRGLSRARGETGLLVLVHNLLAVDNALEKKKPAPLVENPEKIAC